MPKKKNELSQAEQSKRFRDAVQELVDAGELSPTEAEERFEKAVRTILPDGSSLDS
jgi:hypothetical protein